VCALGLQLTASNHREAPITAPDPKADITDLCAFRSYDGAGTAKITLLMCVDPLLDPANGPNWFPFDDEILYEIKIDNDHRAREDLTFQFRFDIRQRLPSLFQVYAGFGSAGAVQYVPPIAAAGTSPGPVADLLRLNTGVPPTPVASTSRLGLVGGDNAGFPNGRAPL
jgi:hypothetical protein